MSTFGTGRKLPADADTEKRVPAEICRSENRKTANPLMISKAAVCSLSAIVTHVQNSSAGNCKKSIGFFV
ncbi:hypothetical protein CXIVA_07300 [Clostridium sp. SY8519]|jgi:hypothetical protein|nr:hypothetical protein CXIVA_07300 [Clostridium sp. SY8519]